MRIIMHVDMNSYFASCEQQDDLALRGKPVGVCEHLGGIIIAPSIEAKQWGVKTAMPVWEARKLCPQIILTKTNPDRYRHYTRKFLKVLYDYTDLVEKYSIDEAFLDITAVTNIRQPDSFGNLIEVDPFEEARRMGAEIQWRVTSEVGDWLRCSVGVGWNKLVAKIASDMEKPSGLVILRPSDKPMLYERLVLVDVPGIGNRMARRLATLGIRTLADLRDSNADVLYRLFGIMGRHLYAMGQFEGSWKEGFGREEPLKSIGHMYTIPKEDRRGGVLETVLYQLSEMVAMRLRVQSFTARSLYAHARSVDDEYFGKGAQLGLTVQDGRDIFLWSRRLLAQAGMTRDMVTTSIGVTAGDLSAAVLQPSLFPRDRKIVKLGQVLDTINDKYGQYTIGRAVPMGARRVIRDSVGFGRMKEFKVNPSYGGGSR